VAELAVYAGLFLNAFVAATLLPAASEATFGALLLAGEGSALLLFLAATAGNTAGSCINWWLGREARRFQGRRWFPFKTDQFDRASGRFQRYGVWSLLFAWLPIIGDPLTFIAGTLKIRFCLFLPLVLAGKAARYSVIWAGIATAST